MTYQQTIDFLYEQLPMFSRIGAAAYKKDLHNTIALLECIGNPHLQFKSIHIAGTNGKGSTSHMLAAVMQANGYKTGLYTSPHLKDFRERIKIDGEWIEQDFVVDFVENIKPAIAEIAPSFFELTVAMAFAWFARQAVDIAIIETGLGGRLDSTNVIQPELSIITNIGYDHMNLLGNTLPEIAFEKAGIIKKDTAVVIGETNSETKPVFKAKASEMDATLLWAEESFKIISCQYELDSLEVQYEQQGSLVTYKIDLPGIYQQYNLRSCLTAIQQLQQQGWKLADEQNRYALAHVKQLTGLRGRWQLVHQQPAVILDVAHNEDGIKQILLQLQLTAAGKNISFVIGMAKDKEVDKALALFPKNTRYYFTNAHIPRALPAVDLQAKAQLQGLVGQCFDDVNTAISAAIANSSSDLIIVCGSVFVVGEVDVEALSSKSAQS